MEELIKKIEKKGNIIRYTDFGLAEFDDIVRKIDEKGRSMEHVIFCPESFLQVIKDMLPSSEKGQSYGHFKKTEGDAMNYVCEMAFSRGSYTFFVVLKPIKDVIIIPVYAKTESRLAKRSFLLKNDQ